MVLRILLAIGSILLTLLCLEAAFRVVQPAGPAVLQPQIRHIYVPRDPAVGRLSDYWYIAPNQDAYQLDVPVRTSSIGIRNREVSAEKPLGDYRILVLGDSHAFGYGVVEERTWPRLLETKLRRSRVMPSLEVINAGVEGLSVEQEVQLLEDRLLSLKPDLIILTYYWNDMPMRGLPNEPWPEGAEMLPSTMISQTGPASSQPGSAARAGIVERAKRVLKNSYLLYTVVQHVPALQARFYPTGETQWKNATLEGRESPRIRSSWTFVESQIVRLKALGVRDNFKTMVVVVPLFEQMISDAYPKAAYQTELIRIGRDHAIDVVDPLPAIRASKPSYPRSFIPFDGHPNGLIYEVVAGVVAAHLSTSTVSVPSAASR
jgi:hypothetical protein